MKKIFTLMAVFLITGCANMTKPDEQAGTQAEIDVNSNQLYWVNSWQRTCQGVSERMCLQVQKVNQNNQEKPDIENWQLFYAAMEGFDYELGHVYKIRVKESKRPPAQVPADASSIRYELLEVLDKSADDTLRLYDIWVLTEIKGKAIDKVSLYDNHQEVPTLEFNLSTMQVYGSDSCNRFSGGIEILGQGRMTLGALAGTLMACPDMKLADDFTQALFRVSHYALSGLTLRLLDADKNTLLQFKKVD